MGTVSSNTEIKTNQTLYKMIKTAVLIGCIIAVSARTIFIEKEKVVEEAPVEQNYAYEYAVKSDATLDQKSHVESRKDNVTRGEYMVVQPDGMMRITKYEAHPDTGYQAEVTYKRVMDPFPEVVREIQLVQAVEDAL